ncbi:MAG: hypothetical protein A3E85_02395 [Gammaproteobacteria bacterium RIFCSPHIGHO2_12_FULL_45_12]|nr:MAG: hypothetical protein A3E85_02395 [Gammaproteobacteria bacterium RIFCSPHIGHO2_12_FULL_45_12]
MKKEEVLIVTEHDFSTSLTVYELSEACHISVALTQELVDYGIICPERERDQESHFDLQQLSRLKTALRLQQDLEINWVGVVVVLDLLDEMDVLRERAKLFEKHFFVK